VQLYLIRHAQSKSNVGHALDTGFPGAELTGLGHEQAARLVTRLADWRIDAVAASPLTRAQQTAAPVAASRGLTVLSLDGLREIAAGDLEMQTGAAAIDSYRRTIVGWATGDLDMVMPGGWSGHAFLDRYDSAVRALEAAATAVTDTAANTVANTVAEAVAGVGASAGPGPSAVAVSHGAAIRTWVAARCRDVEGSKIAGPSMANTGVMVVEGSSADGWELVAYREELVDDLPATGLADAGGH
jgi:probable phosphoglycerate mutase